MRESEIFCLEGDWSDSLIDRLSVRPGLDMFTAMRGGRLIHRNAATRDEFAHYFGPWAARRYDSFPVAYLAYQGKRPAAARARRDHAGRTR